MAVSRDRISFAVGGAGRSGFCSRGFRLLALGREACAVLPDLTEPPWEPRCSWGRPSRVRMGSKAGGGASTSLSDELSSPPPAAAEAARAAAPVCRGGMRLTADPLEMVGCKAGDGAGAGAGAGATGDGSSPAPSSLRFTSLLRRLNMAALWWTVGLESSHA